MGRVKIIESEQKVPEVAKQVVITFFTDVKLRPEVRFTGQWLGKDAGIALHALKKGYKLFLKEQREEEKDEGEKEV